MNDNEPGDMGPESTAGDAVQVRLAQRINAKPWVDVTYQLRASDNDTPEQDAARLARLRRMATAALDDIEALIAERGKLRAQPVQQRSTHPLVLRDGESVLPSLADLLAARGSGCAETRKQASRRC